MIGGRRPLQGRKPADRRVRVERPHAPYFRYTGPGQLVAKPAANVAADAERPVLRARPRRRLRTAALDRGGDRRAPAARRKALAIFSSDAISSSAYATEEILRVLLLAGASALLLSHRGRDRDHHPAGGRLAVVPPGLSRLSRTAAARTSWRETNLAPDLRAHRRRGAAHRLRHDRGGLDGRGDRPDPVGLARRPTTIRIEIAFVSIALITIANLRGLRESGNIFAVPTYLFVGLALLDRRDRARQHHRRDGRPGRRRSPTPCPFPSPPEALGDPAPAQGLRRRFGRADRRRGDRQRRARPSSRPSRRTRRTR